ncbi:hypothetical protein AK830_g4727 [Neonectria ditissima]|uniref:Uncharacterized protein n=1 Tax=Neonectria ditissima TaxID=78410 RepID=A0A0P7B7P8_9HYPO|nr:hypothetical protein AK830_g4727 [Neonectria ditissima]
MAANTNFDIPSDYVKRGSWTNHDGSAALGGRITVDKDSADLIAIFVGIFIVFVEGGLWTLLTFALFHWNRRSAKKHPGRMEGLFHQQQTLLRNSGTDIAVGMAYLKLWRVWGDWKRRPDVAMRTLPLMLLALLSFFGFLVGLPLVTAYRLLDSQDDQVLIRSPHCGFWTVNLADDESSAFADLKNQSLEAMSYVDSCYEGHTQSALCDRFLPRRNLPVATWNTEPCPFNKSLCLSDEKLPAFSMKTETLDSHKDFGINSPPDGRVKIQRITTCAPLAVDDFSKTIQGTLGDDEITAVYFGSTSDKAYTFGVSNYQSVAGSNYNLQVFTSNPMNGSVYSSTFNPIKGLQRRDADLSVIFLNNNGIPIKGTDGACKDPLFAATKKQLSGFPDYYWPDSPVTAVGCIDQYIFGDPVRNVWTEPASWADAPSTAFIAGLSKQQAATVIKLSWSQGQPGGIGTELIMLGTEALRAQKYPGLVVGLQTPLPDDQWKREVLYWFKIGLAKMQLLPISVSTGPPDVTLPGLKDMLPVLSADRDDLVEIICSTQKIHDTQFKNFHRTGFVVLAAVGGLLIVVPALVTSFMGWRWKQREDMLAWTSYGQLQLQRMAAEGAGVNGWQGFDDEVPFLKPQDLLAGHLNVGNKDGSLLHPAGVPGQDLDGPVSLDGKCPAYRCSPGKTSAEAE